MRRQSHQIAPRQGGHTIELRTRAAASRSVAWMAERISLLYFIQCANSKLVQNCSDFAHGAANRALSAPWPPLPLPPLFLSLYFSPPSPHPLSPSPSPFLFFSLYPSQHQKIASFQVGSSVSSKFAAASFISCKSDEPIATDGASRGARVFPSPLDLGLSPPVGTSNYVQLTMGGWVSLTDGSQTKLEDLSVLR